MSVKPRSDATASWELGAGLITDGMESVLTVYTQKARRRNENDPFQAFGGVNAGFLAPHRVTARSHRLTSNEQRAPSRFRTSVVGNSPARAACLHRLLSCLRVVWCAPSASSELAIHCLPSQNPCLTHPR
jgi:hypothetical protein